MKNQYGMPYTPLTKSERSAFAEEITRLIKFDDEQSEKLNRKEIDVVEYSNNVDIAASERRGIEFVLARLGWRYDVKTGSLVIKDLGKLI